MSGSGTQLRRWIADHRRLLAIIAFLLAILLSVVWLWIDQTPVDKRSTIEEFLIAFIPNVATVPLLFVISYLVLRESRTLEAEADRGQLADEIANRFHGIINSMEGVVPFYAYDWKSFIRKSKRIDIVVQYFGGWISVHKDDFMDLFEREGQVRIVLPDPTNEPFIRAIANRFPEHTPQRIKEKIQDTAMVLRTILSEAKGKPEQLSIVYTSRLIWYCGIRQDETLLTLSPFEHVHSVRVEAPVVAISLAGNVMMGQWFEREWQGLYGAQEHRA